MFNQTFVDSKSSYLHLGVGCRGREEEYTVSSFSGSRNVVLTFK